MLKKCSSTSSPGADGISYAHMKEVASCHHFLATLYSKILCDSQEAPYLWCSGKMILIHKKVETSIPSNFRPIALTSTIGKLTHKFISHRLEHFCLKNDILDSSVQKGFLHGSKRYNGAHTLSHIHYRTCQSQQFAGFYFIFTPQKCI